MRAWLIAIAAPPAGRKATSREESPYANAVLRSVNVTMALAAPGIVAVWTAAEIADLPPIDFRDPAAETLRPYRQPLLARERLRSHHSHRADRGRSKAG
jgi:CO/xanthine dehydrogenase Mo-binding subunit